MSATGVTKGAAVLYLDEHRRKKAGHVVKVRDDTHVDIVVLGDDAQAMTVTNVAHRSCAGVGGSIEYVDTGTSTGFARHVIKDPPATFVPYWM